MLLDNPFESDLRVEKEARSLIAAGFNVLVVCAKSLGFPNIDSRNGIRIERSLNDFFKHPLRSGYQRELRETAERISEKSFHVIHCHDVFMLRIGLEIKKLNPETVLVYDAHEYYRGWPFYMDTPNMVGRIKGKIVWKYLLNTEAKAIKSCDLVLCPTAAISDRLQRDHKLKSSPVSVRNVPIENHSNITGSPIDLKSKLSIPNEAFLMVQSGNIYQDDNELDRLFRTVSSIENLHFVLIGNNAKFNRVKAKWESDQNINGRIHFVEYDQNTLMAMLYTCDFGFLYVKTDIYDAHFLGSPNRIMEYSISGLPYVSVNHALSTEMNSQFNHVIFYQIHDHKNLKAAFEKMIVSLPKMRENASRIKSNLSWDNEFEPVIAYYKSLAPKSNEKPMN